MHNMSAWVGRGLFWAGSLIIAVLSLRFLTVPLTEAMAHMAHYLPVVPVPLYAHILGGPLALALAPFQFWHGLRMRWPRLHRVMGYGYAGAILVAGLGSLALLPQFAGTLWAATGFGFLAVLWLGTTARGVWLARSGDHAAHRRWMRRSVALTFAAVTLRVIMAPLIANGWSVVETYQITAWACWVPNLVAVELWARRGRVG